MELSLSSRVAPLIGEYERFSTTVADAYVKGKVRRAIGGLTDALHREGFAAGSASCRSCSRPAASRPPATRSQRPIRLLESGPAAGALAAAFHGALAGATGVLSLDMGGTTAKACLIEGGRAGLAPMLEAARVHRFKPGSGLPVAIPVVDLIEIGAGGGSIARVDELGLLKVGPDPPAPIPVRPATAAAAPSRPSPTPTCCSATWTTARSWAAGCALDRAAAETALGPLADELGLSRAGDRLGHPPGRQRGDGRRRPHPRHREEQATRAATPARLRRRRAGARRWRSPRLLDIDEVIFPPGAGVASALGCLVAPPSISLARTYAGRLDALDWARVERVYASMEAEARAALHAAGVGADATSRSSARSTCGWQVSTTS